MAVMAVAALAALLRPVPFTWAQGAPGAAGPSAKALSTYGTLGATEDSTHAADRIGTGMAVTPAVKAASEAATSRSSGGKVVPAHGKAQQESDKGPQQNTPAAGNFPGLSFSTKSGPIDIKSDQLSLDYKAKTVLFSGHVQAVQSGSEMTSDKLLVNYLNDFNDIKDAVADGNVRLSQGGRWATSDHAVANEEQHTVVLTGNPVVHEGPDQIAGKKITVYLQTGQSVVEGGAHALLYPHNNNQGPGESKPLASAQGATAIQADPKK